MPLDGALRLFRRREEAQFRSRCRIVRSTGAAVTDPATGQVTFPEAVVYEGRCKIKHEYTVGWDVDVAGTELRVLHLVLTLPAGTPVERDDRVRIVASPDPGAVGRWLRVTDVRLSDWLPTRKCQVEWLHSPAQEGP